MKRRSATTLHIALAVAMLAALVPGVALAAPGIPMQLFGSVAVAGSAAPDGTPVSARFQSGQTVTVFKATTTSGGTFAFNVPADDPDTGTVKEGFVSGDTLLLFVGEVQATSLVYQSAASRSAGALSVSAAQALTITLSVSPSNPVAGVTLVSASGIVRNLNGAAVSGVRVTVDWGDLTSSIVETNAQGAYFATRTYSVGGARTVAATAFKSGFLGASTSQSIVVASATADSTPPAAPTNLIATGGATQVTLTWSRNTETDVAHYLVFRRVGATGDFTQREQVTHPASGATVSFVDTGLTAGTEHFYRVRAVDTSGNNSDFSNTASATPSAAAAPVFTAPGDTTPPSFPTGLSATPGDKQVFLSWTANPESDVSQYRVERSLTSGTGFSSVGTTNASGFLDLGLTNGTTYFYRIRAVDSSNNASSPSQEVSAVPRDVTPPAAPTGLATTAGDAQVSLAWTGNAEQDLAGYHVYQAVAGGAFVRITASPVTSPSYTDTGLFNGTLYSYQVTAVDTANNESARSATASATPVDKTPPPVPAGLAATAGDRQVSLSWSGSAALDLAGYYVYQATTAGGPYTRVTSTPIAGTEFTVAGLTNETAYFLRVSAVDLVGNESGLSNEASATPRDRTAPSPPGGLTATTGNQQVSLSWNTSPELDVAGYQVFRALASGGPYSALTSVPIAQTGFTDGGLTNGVTYFYVVRAVDRSANVSAASSEVSATPGIVAVAPTPVATPLPTTLSLSELAVSPGEVSAGDPVTVTVRVSNPGAQPQAYTIDLLVNGEAVERVTGTLAGGESRLLTFAVVRSVPGLYQVAVGSLTARFSVLGARINLENLSVSPAVVGPGDPVEISATVSNPGGAPGAYDFALTIDGAQVAKASGVLLRGASTPLLFVVSRQAPRAYAVVLGPLQSSFVVVPPTVDVAVATQGTASAQATATDAAGNAVSVVRGGATSMKTAEVELPITLPSGVGLGTFSDPVSGITAEAGKVTVPLKDAQGNVQMNLVIQTTGLTGTGTTAKGTVTSLALQSPSQEVDLSTEDPTLGRMAVTVNANLNRLPPDASVRMTPKATLPPAARSGFELLAQGANNTIAGVGGALEVETTNLPNGAQGVGTVDVCIAVSPAWVAQHGGQTFQMAHLTTDPTTGAPVREFLSAQRQPQPDAQGRVVFCAQSPSGFSSFALVAIALQSADLRLSNLAVTPDVLEPGGVVSIQFEVANQGGQAATQTLVLKVNGEAVSTRTATVRPGETVKISFLQKPEKEGVYFVEVGALRGRYEVTSILAVADVRLSDFQVTPAKVQPGTPVEVAVTVVNVSIRRGKFDVVLTINGVAERIQSVALAPGVSQRVSFQVLREKPGEYKVAVETLAGSFAVERAPRPAAFAVVDLRVEPAEAAVGQEVAITVIVENTGDLPGTYEAVVTVSGEEVRRTVEVAAQSRARLAISFSVKQEMLYDVRIADKRATFRGVAPAVTPTPPTPPTPTPPAEHPAGLAVQALRLTPERVDPGQPVAVQVDVVNTGGQPGSLTIRLVVDGREVASREVTVQPGATETVVFQVVEAQEGSHRVEVNGQSGTFEVVRPAGVGALPLVALAILAAALLAAGAFLYYRRRVMAGR